MIIFNDLKTYHFQNLKNHRNKIHIPRIYLNDFSQVNECLKALKNKGLVKMKNFHQNPNKLNYAYVLTPKGVAEKTKLTINFMKRKMKEYDELKSELKKD